MKYKLLLLLFLLFISMLLIFKLMGLGIKRVSDVGCGDNICDLNENPINCYVDCGYGYKQIITCIWDENECIYRYHWFWRMVMYYMIVVVIFSIYKAIKKHKEKKDGI